MRRLSCSDMAVETGFWPIRLVGILLRALLLFKIVLRDWASFERAVNGFKTTSTRIQHL